MSLEEKYIEGRKKARRRELMDFLTKNLIRGLDYDKYRDLKNYVDSDFDEQGEIGAFCDFYELGHWFEEELAGCDFDVYDFIDYYRQVLDIEEDD